MRIFEIISPHANSQVTNTDILIHDIIVNLRSSKQINAVELAAMKESVLLAEKSKMLWALYESRENFKWLEKKILRCKKMLIDRGVTFDNNSLS